MQFRRKITLGDLLNWIIIGLFIGGFILIIFGFLKPTKPVKDNPSSQEKEEETHKSSRVFTITNEEINKFVEEYIHASTLDLSRENNDKLTEKLQPLLRLYDEKVNYFYQGNVNKSFIIRDKIEYYSNCRKVKNTLKGTVKIKPSVRNIVEISFYIDFSVFSLKKHKNIVGWAENKLTLRKINGHLYIIRETQEIFHREFKDD